MRLEKDPIEFLRRDDQNMIGITASKELRAKGERLKSDGPITNERISRAIDTEHGREVAGRGVVNRLREKHRTRRVRALLGDLFVKAPRVLDPATRDAKDQGEAGTGLGCQTDVTAFHRRFSRRR